MNTAKFIEDVGAAAPERRVRDVVGHVKTPSTEYFAREYPAVLEASRPGRRPPIVPTTPRPSWASPIAQAGKRGAGRRSATPSARCSTPRAPSSTRAPAEFRKAFALIKEGKPIRYVGVIGPVQFDRYGDITGPFRLWRIQDGQVTDDRRDVGRGRRPAQGQAGRGDRPCRGPTGDGPPSASGSPAPRSGPAGGHPRLGRHGHPLGGRWPATRGRCASATASSSPAPPRPARRRRRRRAIRPRRRASSSTGSSARSWTLGGRLRDVVRTRVYVRRLEDWEAVARVHGERFGRIRPANTLVQAGLVGDDLPGRDRGRGGDRCGRCASVSA